MKIENGTVTMPLESYEEMKDRISYLEKLVEEKTIVRRDVPTMFGITMLSVVVCVLYYLLTHHP